MLIFIVYTSKTNDMTRNLTQNKVQRKGLQIKEMAGRGVSKLAESVLVRTSRTISHAGFTPIAI
jgi:hypothetical protein